VNGGIQDGEGTDWPGAGDNALMSGQEQGWWSVRMLVEIPAKDDAPEEQVGFPKFEDRIILVRAADEREATTKGEEFAAEYGEASSWVVRKIVDVQQIIDRELGDGVEIYSAFIGAELAEVLMRDRISPVAEWQQQNPDREVDEATVREVLDAWDNREEGTSSPAR